MRSQLEAVVDELKTMRAEGIDHVLLHEATWEALQHRIATAVPTETALAHETPADVANEPKVTAQAVVSTPSRAATASSTAAQTPTVAAKKPASGLPEGVAPIPEPTSFTLPDGDKSQQWHWLRDKVLSDPVCNAHLRPGDKVVLGVGNLDADIFFCGEAPGEQEAKQGEPFVGPAGQLLDRIISAMGLKRAEVYIGNIMNWRPEHNLPRGNRKPVAVEMAYCLPHLLAQLDIVQPKVIVALGSTAIDGLLGQDPNRRMRRIRGHWQQFQNYPLMPTYHPSYLLHNDSKSVKREVWEDMLALMARLNMPISEKQRNFFT